MNTPSHFLITATLQKTLPRLSMVKRAVLIGSIAPDVPLWLLSIGGIIYYHYWLGWSKAQAFTLMFDELYFHHPVWIALHNFLHSPVLLLIGLSLVWRDRHQVNTRSRWLFWFLSSCLFHSCIDILTHVDDGPLLFFPLDWTTRFHSVVSYYDDRYYGREFEIFERSLDIGLIIYLVMPPIYRYIRRKLLSNG